MGKKKFEYGIVKQGKTTVLVMNPGITDLVRNALEIVNPDDEVIETIARDLALHLERE